MESFNAEFTAENIDQNKSYATLGLFFSHVAAIVVYQNILVNYLNIKLALTGNKKAGDKHKVFIKITKMLQIVLLTRQR